jgi:rubrerythrin
MEREREQRKAKFMADQEARHAETLKRIMGEENARNGRALAAT